MPTPRLFMSILLLCACACTKSDAPAAAQAPERPIPVAKSVPDKAPEDPRFIKDTEQMCEALVEDYVDGTLSDVSTRVRPKSQKGQQLRLQMSESATPGRDLLGRIEHSLPPHCKQLAEIIDDVE